MIATIKIKSNFINSQFTPIDIQVELLDTIAAIAREDRATRIILKHQGNYAVPFALNENYGHDFALQKMILVDDVLKKNRG